MTAVQRAVGAERFATFEFRLRLDPDSPVAGELNGREFCGWVDLMSVIDGLRGEVEAPVAPNDSSA